MKGVDYENQKKWTRKFIALYSILDVAIQIFHAGGVSVTHDLEYLRLIRVLTDKGRVDFDCTGD